MKKAMSPRLILNAVCLSSVMVAGLSAMPSAHAQTAATAAKKRIDKAADLPRFNYPAKGNLETWVRDETVFAPFAAKLRADLENVLKQYDIADKSMQRQMLTTLLQLDILEGKDLPALARIEAIRTLEEKPADQLMSGMQTRAMIQSRLMLGNSDTPAYRAEVGRRIAASLKDLPYLTVANEVKSAKARAELVGETLVLGNVRNVLQPIVDKSGALSSELAPDVVSARYSLLMRLPLKQTLIDTFGTYLTANKVDKADIWAARGVTLPESGQSVSPGKTYTPVTVAVWDSGVDSAIFKNQVLRDSRGKALLSAFDKYGAPSDTELAVLPPTLLAKLPQMIARTKGFSDLQSNVESPEATDVKQFLSSLKPDEFKPAIEEINLAGGYEHGTHVAGIAMDGNPHARLLIARMGFGHTLIPDPCPSRAQSAAEAKALSAQIAFLKQNKARVVNMSWGGSVSAIESELEKCESKQTPEQRKTLARELIQVMRDALQRGFASAPDVLWIAAAGNSNQDASFAENAPADLVLPNLLTVGAVDRAGDEADFTSYGPTVKVHANGYQVESYLPGGQRVALSGTSMAAPQVANLAGKLLAVNPKLTPPQVIQIIVSTADKSADGRRTLLNPVAAMAKAVR
jgi:subtilisin family serine protease